MSYSEKEQNILKTLKVLVQEAKNLFFVNPDKTEDSEAIGILLSKFSEFDGLEILRASFSALEDSNFHTEAKEIKEILERAEKDFS